MAARLEAFFLREWQQGSGWQLLLRPISWVYRLIVAVRCWMFSNGILKSHRVAVPVIVVGNITVGGTGKTPVVLALAQYLNGHGEHPGIATRGYMRQTMLQTHGQSSPGMVIHVVAGSTTRPSPLLSDEAVLLSERSGVPVFAGAKRVEVANALLNQFQKTSIVLSDDGLQHYALKRDIEIAVIDAERLFGNRHCLPAGPLREPISRLDLVDCIVLNTTALRNQAHRLPLTATLSDSEATIPVNLGERWALSGSNVPVFEMTLGNGRMSAIIRGGASTDALSATAFQQFAVGKRIVAIAGIGNPQRFFDQLRGLDIVLHGAISFPDHHVYRIGDIRAIDADLILMTEKDAVKCREFASVDERLWMMQVDAELPDAFYEFVLKKIQNVARPKVA